MPFWEPDTCGCILEVTGLDDDGHYTGIFKRKCGDHVLRGTSMKDMHAEHKTKNDARHEAAMALGVGDEMVDARMERGGLVVLKLPQELSAKHAQARAAVSRYSKLRFEN